MRGYESLIVVDPDVNEEKISEVLKEISEQIESQGGKVKEIENLGRKEIQFKTKNKKRGYFFLAKFHADPLSIVNFRSYLQLKPEIIRYYTTLNKDIKKEGE